MRTKMTTEIVCPYCGTRQERGIRNIEVYSITYTETECENCGHSGYRLKNIAKWEGD